jgi:hypothetical protein
MRKSTLGLAAALALSFGVSFCSAEDKKVSGILIDDHCAANFTSKDNPEQAAASHKASCAIKCAKDGNLVLLTGKKELKLDKAGKDKALAYLAKADANTHVTITGEVTGDEIKVTDIKAAGKESKDKDSSK